MQQEITNKDASNGDLKGWSRRHANFQPDTVHYLVTLCINYFTTEGPGVIKNQGRDYFMEEVLLFSVKCHQAMEKWNFQQRGDQ